MNSRVIEEVIKLAHYYRMMFLIMLVHHLMIIVTTHLKLLILMVLVLIRLIDYGEKGLLQAANTPRVYWIVQVIIVL